MTTPWSIVIILLTGVAAFAIGRGTGYSAGKATQQAQTDRAAVIQLEEIVESSAALVINANAASNAMRAQTAARAAADRKTTKELRDVLELTSGDRMLCRFDADSMRLIAQARERATQSAAGGIRGAVPSTTAAGQ